MSNDDFPVVLLGSDVSYFTGKMENYLRIKGIPYELRSMQFPQDSEMLKRETGVSQMPSVQLADGRWMTDTTQTIQWLESRHPSPALTPEDPLMAFVCRLLEDYADEWLWRPAMHYRWYYEEGAHFQSRHLANELTRSIPLPAFARRMMLRRRQRGGYTTGDGVTEENRSGVEAIYLRTLQQLQSIFSQRPFILGDNPSLADIGFSGPFFRHFGLDPVPLEIMKQQAPAVYEWVARLWNFTAERHSGVWLNTLPEDVYPLLDEIGQHYMPYLCANVDAVVADKARFDIEVGGVSYRGARYSRYRVWCLAQIREQFSALPEGAQVSARQLLETHHCWEPLWRHDSLPLMPGQEEGLPFKADYKMVGANE